MNTVYEHISDLMAQELVLMQAYNCLNDKAAFDLHCQAFDDLYELNCQIEKALEDP